MKFHWSLVGQWYLRRDTREMLQVLDYDEESGIIGVQNFDGDLDQFDDDCWRALPTVALSSVPSASPGTPSFARPAQHRHRVEVRF
jgi:hypothetical protein